MLATIANILKLGYGCSNKMNQGRLIMPCAPKIQMKDSLLRVSLATFIESKLDGFTDAIKA
ncbi:hypothetical protein VB780_23260 [Leptolyngbya sp. CCNP1308]|uniref:hypothetical protein n=1 Tax=Leptolyngbya sp. CCNP1308 TaxID=3110255 RepID=UPI002B202655|nr:hypothetical protein [Leptolyngbya sp. CCNP1308]MEA5451516.1 hypothetical protein [Leptolyngbya sp. CCNP1308]